MEKYILSIDAGTTSCRSLLIDLEGRVKGVVQKEFSQLFPQSGWVEHNADEIWETQLWTIEQVLMEHQIDPGQILTVGITNQRETTVVWNRKTAKPIYNAIVWQDRRTAGICEKIKQDGFDEYIYSHTGLVVDAYFSGTKLHWLIKEVVEKQNLNIDDLCFGTIDTWLIWKMTNGQSHVTDFTNASRTLMFNIRDLVWDQNILKALSIPASMLPAVKNSADHFGDFLFEGHKIPVYGVA